MTSTVSEETSTRSAPDERVRSDFGPLARRIREAGLLEPSRDFHLASAVLVAGLMWLVVVLLINLHGSPWALAVAPLAAVLSAQLSYLGHDIGHHQVFRRPRQRWLAGVVVSDLLTGLSYGWWNDKHSRHHANPNLDGSDPDVADGVIAWSERQAERRTGFGRWFARHQSVFFLPLLTLTGWALRVDGLRALGERRGAARVVEAVLLATHIVVVGGFLLWVGGFWFMLAFVLVMNLCFGLIMGMAFAPNHKGMLAPEPGMELDHLRKQVLTSRNLTGNAFVDWWYGGLNHQIEHHLFPSMPRPNLARAKPIVKAYCAELGLPYHEVGLRQSYREIFGHLRAVTRSDAG